MKSSAGEQGLKGGCVGCGVVRFIVYGAGAVGGALGALLAEAGRPVVLIARGEHLAAIRRDGLTLTTPHDKRRCQVPAVSGPAEIDWQPEDVVLLAMKTGDTEAALRALAEHADSATAIVCAQNGVANERLALRLFPHVYGVCVAFPATHLTAGVVSVHSAPVPGLLDVGAYPAGVDAPGASGLAARLAAAFRDAGFRSEPRADIMRWKYTKLLMNVGNAVDAVCGRSAEVQPLGDLIRAEGEAVLQAAGIEFASVAEDRQRRGDTLQLQAAVGQPRAGGSSWQSLARGTGSIEADYLNGEIVLLGRLHGVPTPYNEHARRMANMFAREGRAPGSMSAAAWLSRMDQSR